MCLREREREKRYFNESVLLKRTKGAYVKQRDGIGRGDIGVVDDGVGDHLAEGVQVHRSRRGGRGVLLRMCRRRRRGGRLLSLGGPWGQQSRHDGEIGVFHAQHGRSFFLWNFFGIRQSNLLQNYNNPSQSESKRREVRELNLA